MRTDEADRDGDYPARPTEPLEPDDEAERERLETALLAYAHREASRWGAERFAEEFERRDEEERRLTATGAPRPRFPWEPEEIAPPATVLLSGLVDAAVQEQVIRSDPAELDLADPVPIRHPDVPRPSTKEPEPIRPRVLRRSRRQKEPSDPPRLPSVISPAEAARMSPAARRLYGLESAS